MISITCILFIDASRSSSSVVVARGCTMPPTIANGRYQILPWKRSFTSSTSRMWNLNGSSTWPSSSSTLVPVYSSAVYSCFRGYMLTSGSSLISCSPGGWWQPTHNSPQCVPYGSSASSGSSATSGNHYAAGIGPRLWLYHIYFPLYFVWLHCVLSKIGKCYSFSLADGDQQSPLGIMGQNQRVAILQSRGGVEWRPSLIHRRQTRPIDLMSCFVFSFYFWFFLLTRLFYLQ